MTPRPCPLCNSEDSREIQRTLPLRATDPLVESTLASEGAIVTFWLCRTCGMIYREPRPTRAQLDNYYAKVLVPREPQIRERMGISVETVKRRTKKRYADLFLELRPLARREAGHIVDLGGFDGAALEPWHAAGWRTTLVDPSANMRALAFSEMQVAANVAETDGRKADVVTSFHCAEHFDSLADWISDIRALAKPGAMVVVEVPFDVLYVRGLLRRRPLAAPQIHEEHLNFFTPRSLRYLARRLGLRNAKITCVTTLYFFGPTISLRLVGELSPDEHSSWRDRRPRILQRSMLRAELLAWRRVAGLKFRSYRLRNPDF